MAGAPGSSDVVVVTGAASGIGRAIALRFASQGAELVLVDVDAPGLDGTRDLVQREGARVVVAVADVSDEAAVARLAAGLGRCRVLVNNAGILVRGRVSDGDATAIWSRTLSVNLTGAFLMSRALTSALSAAGGAIVNIASVQAVSAVGNSAAYAASKGGLKQLTQALAVELGPSGIRVNAVAPGTIRTAMTRGGTDPAGSSAFLSRVPLGRPGEPAEVAHAVHFLASSEASYINGVTLPVDGGYLAG